MARRRVRLHTDGVADSAELRAGFEAVRADNDVPVGFSPEVLAEAEAASRQPLPDHENLTELPFLTIDPPGSMDLDQAMHLERLDGGFRVRYAIADVAAFVVPGGAIDAETHRRGETLYLPDARVPLHPPALSEGAASLLPDVVRPALVWMLDLNAAGECVGVDLRRSLVRSTRRLDYEHVQQQIDSGADDPQLLLLRDIGTLRLQREQDRGGVALPVPEQEVVTRDGGYALAYRVPTPADAWNAQISLLTGMAAAQLMLDAGVGILRTLPPAEERDVDRLRRIARGLGVSWAADESYAEVVRRLDASIPAEAALLEASTTLLRGAGYVAFDGTLPEQPRHAAIASTYAHVTAPLRRLVDRYGLEVCAAVRAGTPVPDWVRTALPTLPEEMASANRRASAVDRAGIDLIEAAVLAPHVGAVFDGVVVDADEHRGVVQLRDPAVRARLDGDGLPLGQDVRVRLSEATVATRTVRFALA